MSNFEFFFPPNRFQCIHSVNPNGSYYLEDTPVDDAESIHQLIGNSELDEDIFFADDMDDYGYNEENFMVGNANENFLRYLQYPENEQSLIDLQQVAVAIMAHLDRLCKPHQQVLVSREANTSKDISRANNVSLEHIHYLGKSKETSNTNGAGQFLSQNDIYRARTFQKVVSLSNFVVGLTEDNNLWWSNFDNASNTFSKPHFSPIYKFSALITNVDGNVLLGVDDKNEYIYVWSFPINYSAEIDLTQHSPAQTYCPSKLAKVATSVDHFIGCTEMSPKYLFHSHNKLIICC